MNYIRRLILTLTSKKENPLHAGYARDLSGEIAEIG